MQERILGVFPIDVRGWVYDFYDMYFTDKRIIANLVGHGGYARARGKIGTLFSWGGVLEYGIIRPLAKRKEKGPFLDAEQILKVDKNNFAWDYQNDIRSIKFRKKTGLWGPPAMVVRLVQGKEKLCVFRKEHFDNLKSLLQEVIGEKLVPE